VPVAEYRPNSRSIFYRVNPATLSAAVVLRFPDHIGAVAVDTDDRALHGVSWGSRRFYRWALNANGSLADPAAAPEAPRTINPSHYIDYQDCKYAGARLMLCTGLSELGADTSRSFRLGGVDLVSLQDGRPVHQVPVPLWTSAGVVMTQNPSWFEATATGLRAWFVPEDDRSTLYVYEVETGR